MWHLGLDKSKFYLLECWIKAIFLSLVVFVVVEIIIKGVKNESLKPQSRQISISSKRCH